MNRSKLGIQESEKAVTKENAEEHRACYIAENNLVILKKAIHFLGLNSQVN
jgi:hypothetical protein